MIASLLQGEDTQVIALDVFIETDSEMQIERGKTQVLVNRDDQIVQVVNVCSLGRGRPRDVSEKHENKLLDPNERVQLESVLVLTEVTQAGLVRAHLELARIMQRRGCLAASQLNAPYLKELEYAVLGYVYYELNRMGLAAI